MRGHTRPLQIMSSAHAMDDNLPQDMLPHTFECEDGSYMVMLDSGAEGGVLPPNMRNVITTPSALVMNLVSFGGDRHQSLEQGNAVVAVKTDSDSFELLDLGEVGIVDTVSDPIVSVPSLLINGCGTWLGPGTYLQLPNESRVPLYQSQNGYTWLRIYPQASGSTGNLDTKVNTCQMPSQRVFSKTYQIGWVKNDRTLWHHRLCHQNDTVITKTSKATHGIPELKRYLPRSGNPTNNCLSCALGKSCEAHIGPTKWQDLDRQREDREKLTGTDHPSRKKEYLPLQQLHLDCCEMDSPDFYGNYWYLLITDRSTGYKWIVYVVTLADLYKVVDEFLDKVAAPYLMRYGTERKFVEVIRTDSGPEFVNEAYESVLHKRGNITHSITSVNVKDGKVERAVQTVTWLLRTCLIEANLRKTWWSLIAETIVHVLNRSWNVTHDGVPFTLMFNQVPDVSYFRQPGCWAIAHIMDKDRSKLDERAKYVRFVGYDVPRRCWVFVNPKTGRKIRTIHATFFERRRDPHEHVDISDMILVPPSIDEATDTSTGTRQTHWKCQLWPTHHWPGRTIDEFEGDPDLSDWNPDHTPVTASEEVGGHFDFTQDDRLTLKQQHGEWRDQAKHYSNDPSLYECTFSNSCLKPNPEAPKPKAEYIWNRSISSLMG